MIGRYGHTPKAAIGVELRANPDGTLPPHAEGHAMLDFGSGDPIVLPADVSDAAAAAAIDEPGATTKRDRWYGVKQDDAKAKAAGDLDAAMGDLGGILGATPAAQAQPEPEARAAPAKTAKRRGGHPATVMGSRILALVSANGGISLRLLSDLSHRQDTARKDKNGRPLIQWRNPPVPGVGPLFRQGGTEDRQELARVLEESGYLMPGSIEADGYEAGNRAMEIISDALNRIEALTHDQTMTEAEASQRAEREAYYAERDAENQAEADAEREAIMAVAAMSPSELRSTDDDDIPDIFAAPSQEAMLQDFGFTDEDINAELQIAAASDRTEEDRATQAIASADREAPSADGAGSPAPGPAAPEEGSRQGLILEAQSEQDLREKTDRDAAAAEAERAKKAAEQARLKKQADDKEARARADATVKDFQLGQSADDQLSGQTDIFGSPSLAESASEAPAPADQGQVDPLRMPKDELNARIAEVVSAGDAADTISGLKVLRERYVRATGKPSLPPPGTRWIAITPESLAARDAPAAPAPRQLTDAEAYADNFSSFDGRELAQQVLVEDTGQIATLRMDAAAALREQSARLDALRSLRTCLGARS